MKFRNPPCYAACMNPGEYFKKRSKFLEECIKSLR